MGLADLDLDCWRLVAESLEAGDIARLQTVSRSVRLVVGRVVVKRLNFSRQPLAGRLVSTPPTGEAPGSVVLQHDERPLPYPTRVPILPNDQWSALVAGRPIADVDTPRPLAAPFYPRLDDEALITFFSCRQVPPSVVESVVLDGASVTVEGVKWILQHCPRLHYLSLRWCGRVDKTQLEEALASAGVLSLERIDCVGVKGLAFFRPEDNGMEYDYDDYWREAVFDFYLALCNVKTVRKMHQSGGSGQALQFDVHRCTSVSGCREEGDSDELALPMNLEPCICCGRAWTLEMCRYCLYMRQCQLCEAWVCPRCYTSVEMRKDHTLIAYSRQNSTIEGLRELGARKASELGLRRKPPPPMPPQCATDDERPATRGSGGNCSRVSTCWHQESRIRSGMINPRSVIFQFHAINQVFWQEILNKTLARGFRLPQV